METEQEKAHRIFKFYKAAGKFPNKVSELEGWKLLKKYNYSVARNIDKNEVNALTELVNVLNRERMVIVLGDFELETLMFGLRSYNNNPSGVNVVAINAAEKRMDAISYSLTATHSGAQTIYVVDNAESLRESDVKKLLWVRDNSDKPVVCCYQTLSAVPKSLKSLKKIRLGNVSEESSRWKALLYKLFNDADRNAVYNTLREDNAPKKRDLALSYLLRLASYNAPQFYPGDSGVPAMLEKAGRHLHKCPEELLAGYLAFGIPAAKRKRVVRFPPTLNDSKRKNSVKIAKRGSDEKKI